MILKCMATGDVDTLALRVQSEQKSLDWTSGPVFLTCRLCTLTIYLNLKFSQKGGIKNIMQYAKK